VVRVYLFDALPAREDPLPIPSEKQFDGGVAGETRARDESLERRSRFGWWIWSGLLLTWFVALCVIPDPRPLRAPEWSVRSARWLLGASDPVARMAATVVLRAIGFGLLGLWSTVLFPFHKTGRKVPMVVLMAIALAPLLAVTSQWINYGHFPISAQWILAVVSAVTGSLLGLALRRSAVAAALVILLGGGLFFGAIPTRIPQDLDFAARLTGEYVLANAKSIPDGDAGFTVLLQRTFAFAEDNSHREGAIFANQAAILALGVLLGDEQVAAVARRRINGSIDRDRLPEIESLRTRIALRGRNDLSRHFWVSAALVTVADAVRSKAVGIAKELMDSTPGGSGFSFVDMAANLAGIRFAEIAIFSQESAQEIQLRILRGYQSTDFCPEIDDLPEGIGSDRFHLEFGGLGGAETRRLFAEIERRLATTPGLVRSP
jgi:hypothetical protein